MSSGPLPDEVKLFCVQALACFDTPSEVAKAVKADFGLEVSRQAVEAYDPNKRAGSGLSQGYREIFETTRKTFLEDTAAIAVSHRAVRLRALQRMIEQVEKRGNYALAAQLLEQAAKECGNAYSNKQRVEHTGADGAPIATDSTLRIEFVKPGKDVPDAADPGTGGV